jgi:glycosyltransferase involved in cell wall biosynthesis
MGSIGIIAHVRSQGTQAALQVPTPTRAARIAVVHDWLVTWGGGENVLAEILALYPEADLYTLVDFLPEDARAGLGSRRAITTFLQRLPGARHHFRKLLPWFPRAIESLDLASYDLILSVSHAVAKGVRTTATQRHACYCLTPMRYAWDLRDAYLDTVGVRGPLRMAANRILDRLRRWDRDTSTHVTRFAAISSFIAARVRENYGREATVIYPPVDTDYFRQGDESPRRGSYFTASRWVPYKRIDAIVQAFRSLPDRQLVVAGTGPEAARIHRLAGANVTFTGELDRAVLREHMRHARAFLFAAEEDFGIAPLEAQACGTPVIAYGRGGVLETIAGAVGPGRSGMFFEQQSAAAIAAAIAAFESLQPSIDAAACRHNAERFATARFVRAFSAFIDAELSVGGNAGGIRTAAGS